MNRTITVLAALAAALVVAAPATSHASGPVLIIRHQMRGCHTWSVGVAGAAKVSQTVWLKRGVHLGIGNNDVMPHELVRVAGPRVSLPDGASMNSIGAMIEVRFPKAGVYRFTTKAGEDYSKGMHTIGPDNTLKLRVIVR
ncbi:MAG: hypothetical protein ACJ744_04025 [Gaiellaceae bacterium]|jgi:hypothetical protein